MSNPKKIRMDVTPDEAELITAIRNYCKTYPDGYPELLMYAQRLFDIMVDMPKNNNVLTANNKELWNM